ncbi:MAG: hypothetical protein U5K79_25655 [Cyclobacteriaceae bacterium]|nr:hypothetical protein [Cyclobacteriaceae bacterium]
MKSDPFSEKPNTEKPKKKPETKDNAQSRPGRNQLEDKLNALKNRFKMIVDILSIQKSSKSPK